MQSTAMPAVTRTSFLARLRQKLRQWPQGNNKKLYLQGGKPLRGDEIDGKQVYMPQRYQ